MTLARLSFVVFLAATALPRLTSVQAQQPPAPQPSAPQQVPQPPPRRPSAIPQPDLSGQWRFTSFGSTWTVDLKPDPKETTPEEKVYCGEAARERLVPDTPIIKAHLCASISPDDGQFHLSVQAATCRAPWRSSGIFDGTCTTGGAMGTMRMDDAMPGPMGGFTAMRIVPGTKK
jgi:hypothetical protein